jgi:hypothetical protein
MFRKLSIVLLFIALFTIPEVAYARYCNNPYCAMCNRIFGPMPGYTIRGGRVYRVQRTTRVIQQPVAPATPPVVQKPTEPEPPVVKPEEPDNPPPKPEPDQPAKPTIDKYPPDPPELLVDATYEPMPQAAVKPMLQQVWPLRNEVVYDLGCGDGRIIIEAVRSFGCKAVGIEINPVTAALAKKNMEESGLGRMLVIQGNATDYSLADANVITMYLFPDVMKQIIPNIRPGTRVVSFEHEIPGVDCTKKCVEIDGVTYTYYTWVKPRESVNYANEDLIRQQSAPQRPFSLVR